MMKPADLPGLLATDPNTAGCLIAQTVSDGAKSDQIVVMFQGLIAAAQTLHMHWCDYLLGADPVSNPDLAGSITHMDDTTTVAIDDLVYSGMDGQTAQRLVHTVAIAASTLTYELVVTEGTETYSELHSRLVTHEWEGDPPPYDSEWIAVYRHPIGHLFQARHEMLGLPIPFPTNDDPKFADALLDAQLSDAATTKIRVPPDDQIVWVDYGNYVHPKLWDDESFPDTYAEAHEAGKQIEF